jgi:hypothetical protein
MPAEEQKVVNTNQSEVPNRSEYSVDAFVKHMQTASAVVSTWPIWKQQVLGNLAVQPTVTKMPHPTGQ